jgi:hypothetical protein
MTDPTVSETMPSVLTAADRCDASTSEQATTVYVRPNGQTLMFCSHHATEYASKLKLLGFTAL